MITRLEQEERENKNLSEQAAKSADSRGRIYPEEECEIRTSFQRDRDRIIHSKAFRRLKHKTQVFIAPEGDHYRTRITHTLEVSQIARTISRGLNLNEDLAEAIALGHDLGHTPFGHTGEKVLNKIHPGGFRHNEQSQRVVEKLEKKSDKYQGLNLTFEVRDGIRGHTGEKIPSTLEGEIVRIADRIAYINHDIDDAQRAGILRIEKIPGDIIDVLGKNHKQRINTMVVDILKNSAGRKNIKMSDEIASASDSLREYLFSNVYIDSLAKKEEGKAENLIKMLYEYYTENPQEILEGSSMFSEYKPEDLNEMACDYIGGMTDRYALMKYKEIFLPHPWALSSQN